MNGHILLVDDDEKVLEFYSAALSRAGYRSKQCSNLNAMRDAISEHSYDAVFLDLNLGGENGLDGLPYVLKNAPFSKVIVLTSQNSVNKAVECMERGASWYFTKGTDPNEIIAKLKSLLEKPVGAAGTGGSDQSAWRSTLIGESKPILETCSTIEKLKDVDSTVLILGESGTGKEVVARAIHQSSPRAQMRFEAINCAAIPENLLESELFGHKRGSFTDAKQDRKGIFEICSKGTLLLDEIGDMPLMLQTKLLRVLQERQIMPVGASTSIPVETRVIAATHRDMTDEVKSGRFREDLYYRLNVVVVNIPALRHRKEDIGLLVSYFLKKFNQRFSKTVKEPSRATLSRLQSYDWPGNIRELQNAVERGVVLAINDELDISHMFSHLNISRHGENSSDEGQHTFENNPAFDMPLTDAKQAFEKAYITRLLKLSHGNIAELSRKSGRYRADLYRMLERYHIQIDEFRNKS